MEYDLCNLMNSISIQGIQASDIQNYIHTGKISKDGFIRENGTIAWTPLKTFIAEIQPSHDNKKIISCAYCTQCYQIDDNNIGIITSCKCGKIMIVPEKDAWDLMEKQMPNNPPSVEKDSTNLEFEEGDICCPHCWTRFALQSLHYQSQHPDLIGDNALGESVQRCFLPNKYNGKGEVIDDMGVVCTRMVCPKCHLPIPESIVDLPSTYFSFIGVPGSGKSYYLTLVTRHLRTYLKENFGISYYESDPELNSVLLEYDRLLSIYDDPSSLVTLPKTQQTGSSFSNQVLLNGLLTDLPKPFVFLFSDDSGKKNVYQNIIMYDNAGEHFQIGSDNILNPATMHLMNSEGFIFFFDPSADVKMRHHCDKNDPQVHDASKLTNQTAILFEVIARLRRFKSMRPDQTCEKPFVVMVGKYDFWRHLFPLNCTEKDLSVMNSETLSSEFDYPAVIETSFRLRNLLIEFAPDFVYTAESFFETVIFVPSSNFGKIAKKDEHSGNIGIRVVEINPIWVTVPMLTHLALDNKIPILKRTIPHYVKEDEIIPINVTSKGSQLLFIINNKRYSVQSHYASYIVEIENKKYQLVLNNTQKESTESFAENNDTFWNE